MSTMLNFVNMNRENIGSMYKSDMLEEVAFLEGLIEEERQEGNYYAADLAYDDLLVMAYWLKEVYGYDYWKS